MISLEDASLVAVVKLADELGGGVICSDVKSEVAFRFGRRNHERAVYFKRLSILHDGGLIRPLPSKRRSEATKAPQTQWVPTAKGRRAAAKVERRITKLRAQRSEKAA